MPLSFDTPDALARDLASFLKLSEREVRDRLTERNWQRIALKYDTVLALIDEGAICFTRAWRIRENPQWAPNRPIRAELKLDRINGKIDAGVRDLYEVLGIDPPADARDRAQSRARDWELRARKTSSSEPEPQ